jgi:hypothetical protein
MARSRKVAVSLSSRQNLSSCKKLSPLRNIFRSYGLRTHFNKVLVVITVKGINWFLPGEDFLAKRFCLTAVAGMGYENNGGQGCDK